MEALVSTAIISIIAVGAIGGLTAMNRIAMTNRLLTLASTVVRDQVDHLQTTGPFNPQLGQIPAALAVGTRTTVPIGYPTAHSPNFPLYTDGSQVIVMGTMTTIVTDTGSQNTYTAVVRVQFQYGNRTHTVIRNMRRTSDG